MTGQPLADKRIVVTRPRAQADELCAKLAALGAQPILFPVIEIVPLEDYSALDAAIQAISTYDWIIFTSVNAVQFFWARLDGAGFEDPRGLLQNVAAIGPATAAALQSFGISPSLVPQHYVAEGILGELGNVSSQRILLPRAEVAREVLPMALREQGALVDEVAAYRTIPASPDPAALAELQRGVDVITFTSSSAVTNFLTLVGQREAANLPYKPVIACLGPITVQTARQRGLIVSIAAATYTTDGLVTALVDYYTSHP